MINGSNGYYYCSYYLNEGNSMDSLILSPPLDSNIRCLWLAWDGRKVLEWEFLVYFSSPLYVSCFLNLTEEVQYSENRQIS